MSYLPLCYAGVQILDVWVAISVAGTVYFPSSEAGKGSGPPQAPGTVSSGGEGSKGKGAKDPLLSLGQLRQV